MSRLLAASDCLAASLLLTGCSSASGSSSAPIGARIYERNVDRCPQASSRLRSPCMRPHHRTGCHYRTGVRPGSWYGDRKLRRDICVFGQYPQMITVNRAPTAGRTKYDRLHTPPTVGTLVELSGIGDVAFGVLNAPVATVEFLQGDTVVEIVVVADGSQDRAVALATAAAGRL